MPAANLVEYFLRRAGAAVRNIFKTLSGSLHAHRRGQLYREAADTIPVLHDRFRFALEC
jgi:hypothetical protein